VTPDPGAASACEEDSRDEDNAMTTELAYIRETKTIKIAMINVQKNLKIHTQEMITSSTSTLNQALHPSFCGADIFLVQEPSMNNTADSKTDMLAVWNDLKWSSHINHDNPSKKGGGAVILAAPHLCTTRLQALEPSHSGVNSGLDIVIASVHVRGPSCPGQQSGQPCTCKPEKQLLIASVYRSGHNNHKHNVDVLCDWLKQFKQKSKRYTGALIAGDFNLHIASAGNTGPRTRSANCQKLESALFSLDLGLLNKGDMTRFPQGRQSGASSGSGLDLAITYLPDPTRNIYSKTRIDATSFQDSHTVGPAWHGSDHCPCSLKFIWPFRIKTHKGRDRYRPHLKCPCCNGKGSAAAEAERRVASFLTSHNLLQNHLQSKEFNLSKEEIPDFVVAVDSYLRTNHLNKPSEDALRFDAIGKRVIQEGGIRPWTVDPEEGMTHLANSITQALHVVSKKRHKSDEENRKCQGKGPRSGHKRRPKRRPAAKNIISCSCPTPDPEEPSQRKDFWSKACSDTLSEFISLRKRAIKLRGKKSAVPRNQGPRAHISMSAESAATSREEKVRKAFALAGKKRTLHRQALIKAQRKFWDIHIEEGLNRFTPASALHDVMTLLENGMKRPSRGDALAKSATKRGGITTDREDPTAARQGSEATNLLTEHFANTTVPLADKIALETISRVDERRMAEGRTPFCPDTAKQDRAKAVLKTAQEWYDLERSQGKKLAPTSAAEADPLPSGQVIGKCFTVAEVTAHRGKKRNKAVWHDRIPSELLDAAGPLWNECFATMLSVMLLTGKWVTWWKNARMKHLLKPKARGYVGPIFAGHTRPVSILPSMAKLAGMIMFARLVHETESKDKGTALGEKQFGFRPHRGCPDNLMSHVQAVKQGWRRGYFAVEICRDAVKAFDKVYHKGLLYKLKHNHGIDGPFLRMVASFLKDRKAHTILGDDVGDIFDLHGGVPQGAVPSPLLYIIDVDGQARLCDEKTSPIFGTEVGDASIAYYADDGRIWILLPGPQAANVPDWKTECKKRLSAFQDLLDESTIMAAMDKQRFSTDPSKLQSTAYIPSQWAYKQDIIDALPTLFVEDKEIKIGTSPLKALGLGLDSGLTFEDHINAKIKTAERRLAVLARLKSMPWYADNHTMIFRVYCPWIASLWEYASTSWGTANPKLLQKIDSIERRALAICLGAPTKGSCSRLALLNEAGIHSAQQRRLIKAAATWHKICDSDEKSSNGSMLLSWKRGVDGTSESTWREEVEEAVELCGWIDIQTERV
jgi:hypothetical protein